MTRLIYQVKSLMIAAVSYQRCLLTVAKRRRLGRWRAYQWCLKTWWVATIGQRAKWCTNMFAPKQGLEKVSRCEIGIPKINTFFSMFVDQEAKVSESAFTLFDTTRTGSILYEIARVIETPTFFEILSLTEPTVGVCVHDISYGAVLGRDQSNTGRRRLPVRIHRIEDPRLVLNDVDREMGVLECRCWSGCGQQHTRRSIPDLPFERLTVSVDRHGRAAIELARDRSPS
ncbi:hypothetical protein ASF14_01370 [Sphingomonas sp. Leaf257]|nr:hypothetical protein ASF14_01370 [Sphingomonas sp. Leaf257]